MHLRTARERKGISQTELARRIGRTQAFIAFLEQGRTQHPSYDDVVAIARELECDHADLTFRGSGPAKRRQRRAA